MRFKSILLGSALSLFIGLGLAGCGYKPASYYAKNTISGNVYVDVTIDVENSTNGVLIKDIINEMVISQFQTTLINIKDKADTIVKAKFGSISHTALETDEEGYTKTYRTNVSITFEYKNKFSNKSDKLTVSDYYDYSVDTDSALTEQKKQEAVKFASQKALQNLFSKIAVRNISK